MNAKEATAKLDSIKPGINYPNYVTITERIKGKLQTIKFNLCSYMVGMYCAIYMGDASMPVQTGDHDNIKFVRKLKKDIARAIKRGAKVEFGSIQPCRLWPDPNPAVAAEPNYVERAAMGLKA